MKMYLVNFSVSVLCILPFSIAHAEEDPIASYRDDIEKPAQAQTSNIHSAYADNVSYLAEKGRTNAIVVSDPSALTTGVANVVVKNANVSGSIIVAPKIDNTTIIVKPDTNSRSKH